MRRLSSFVVWIIIGCVFSLAHGANLTLDLMDSHEFYQLIPRQGPLAEQFTTVVNSPPSPIRTSQKRAARIALILFGDTNSIENKSLLIAFRKRMRELAIDYRLDTYVLPSDQSSDLSSYFKLADTQPDYIVMTQLGFVQRRFAERFLKSGKSKIILYDFATPFVHWMNHPPLMYIGFDQQKATKMLASYLERQLPTDAKISALVLPTSYLGHLRCDLFLDEMIKYKHHVKQVKVVADDTVRAFEATRALLKDNPPDFIFSCSQNISNGVVAAIQDQGNLNSNTQTNSWELSSHGIKGFENRIVKAGILFMRDDLAIAVAEAIKLDLEGKNMPNLYVANSTLISAELDSESLRLMQHQAYHYSVELWQK
ncbi:MAG: substrate-binding domain-containing protein [Oceanospirillaceae bacterium]|nr:substrate-binding domain-containing protein [Oceanospirillaceae bacterium]